MDDGPPIDTVEDSPPDITNGISRKYPKTPMPFEDDESEEYEETKTEPTSIFQSALYILFIAIAIAHLWTVGTMRTDINITMQFLREITQQNKHITDLLHNQHQVKWQIVPSQ
jgi:hypothetical protein